FAAPQMPAPQMAPPPHRAPELVPAVSASAKTLYVAGPAPAAEQKTIVPAMAPRAHPASAPPPIAAHQATMIAPQPAAAPAGFQPPPPIAPSAGSHSVGSPAPPMAIPAALASPYQTSQTGIKGFRPVEPWRSSLRVHMLVWGLLLLAYLLAPVRTGAETTFAWQAIFDGAGWARLAAAAIAAIGLASLILSALPMPAAARGAIAAVLGLAGAALPIAASHELPEYRVLAPMIGLVLLVPGLVMRAAYRDAILPRLLITFGVAGMLVPFVLPIDGSLPLVTIFKAIIEAPTWQARVAAAEPLALIIILVMCLLAWLPAPITGGATLWAWVLILWPLIHWLVPAVVIGDPAQLPALVEAQPSLALAWVQGSSAGIGLGSAYLVLIGYGFAALIGKQLE
ncbi:MAG TPA: hypothetical protein VFP84_04645, partial [Kofleriaceae bacterium]|nr:hypothetical protein [Kofleriaceae bacterium]